MTTRRGFLGLPLLLLAGTDDDRLAKLERDIAGNKELLGLMLRLMKDMASTLEQLRIAHNRNSVSFDQRLDVLEYIHSEDIERKGT